jgi:hypothetical protein
MLKTEICLAILALFMFSALAVNASEQELLKRNQPDFDISVPVGAVIPISLNSYLNTRSSKVGDQFYADTTYPIWIDQRLAIPKGSTIRGTITDILRPGRIKGKGQIMVRFDDILLPNGVKRQLIASFHAIHGPAEVDFNKKSETVSGDSSKGDDVETIVGTTQAGATITAIAARSAGNTAMGAAAGAAAGLAIVLFTRGKDLVLEPGIQFDLELQRPLTFTFNELGFAESQLNNQREIRTISKKEQESRSPFDRRRLFPGFINP